MSSGSGQCIKDPWHSARSRTSPVTRADGETIPNEENSMLSSSWQRQTQQQADAMEQGKPTLILPNKQDQGFHHSGDSMLRTNRSDEHSTIESVRVQDDNTFFSQISFLTEQQIANNGNHYCP